jgi:hypothetical protein
VSGAQRQASGAGLAAIEVRGMTREAFLARVTLAAAAAYGAGAVGPFVREALALSPERREAVGDIGILNFALTIQFIEASFYEEGRRAAPLSGRARTLVDEIVANEAEHVRVLRQVIVDLRGRPVAPPEVSFRRAFGSRASALQVARDLEDTAVHVLVGSGRDLVSKEVLTRLASLAQVEARHSALLRVLQGGEAAPQAFEDTLSIPQARDRLSP